ncbi:hypothetical protein F0562_001410 [Nyssa sinensis]|uniref:Retrotransposon gag domain-containing protein n=1 Tax=Nyssa sinensis TaxID=561372 RepID=A0A5J5C6I2_9ASTE|nr:hypothetical protein F0562_001410 [Nyssa sinensis]
MNRVSTSTKWSHMCEVSDALALQEASVEQVQAALQAVLTELQALHTTQQPNNSQTTNTSTQPEVNPFAGEGSSHYPPAVHFSPSIDQTRHSQLKLHFPKFNGDDPTGWIYKAEQYFKFQNIVVAQRVLLASFHLEGISLQWHRWLTKFRGPLTWEELTKAILHRFGPTDYEDPAEALTRLKQTTTVAAYQEAFERLSPRVDGLSETFLIGCLIAGLQDDIRLDVKIKQPRTLADAIGVARLVEERNSLQKRTTPQGRILPVASMQRGSPNPAVGILGAPPTQRPSNISNPPTTPFRRISSQEARERREKGFCYYCDEKYSMGNRCERPHMFMIEDSLDVAEENSDANGQGAEVLDALPEISFHAIAGAEHPQTLRVWGRLKNKNLMVLIDGGSTHNFIDQATASRFGLYITRNKKFQVVVANQEKIECVGQCQGLTLTIQGVPITADYYVLPVAACQVVLGVQWLETLGPIEMDCKHLTMTFQVGEISHTLHGLKRTAEAANIEALDSKECSGWQGMGFFFQIQISPIETSHSPDAYPEEIRSLLNEYSRVFEAPTGLPP